MRSIFIYRDTPGRYVKVWLAKTEEWDGYRILGVYSSELLARRAIDEHETTQNASSKQSGFSAFHSIQAFDLDSFDTPVTSYIINRTGDSTENITIIETGSIDSDSSSM